MTLEELRELDAKRKEREDELVLLLLLLLASSLAVAEVDDGAATGTIERPTSAQPTPGGAGNLAGLRRILTTFGVPEIAGSMADAHLDAFALVGTGAATPERDALVREYTPGAAEMADAMLDTLAKTGGATLAESLVEAGYSRSNSTGLELGAERQIVTASNGGLIAGAVMRTSGPKLTGFLHRSVIDDRTTAICTERDGLQLPASDPYWALNFPSLHWRCRSVVVPLFGPFKASQWRPRTPPDVGFGRMPAAVRRMIRRLAA